MENTRKYTGPVIKRMTRLGGASKQERDEKLGEGSRMEGGQKVMGGGGQGGYGGGEVPAAS